MSCFFASCIRVISCSFAVTLLVLGLVLLPTSSSLADDPPGTGGEEEQIPGCDITGVCEVIGGANCTLDVWPACGSGGGGIGICLSPNPPGADCSGCECRGTVIFTCACRAKP